jgi:hypothetical protein
MALLIHQNIGNTIFFKLLKKTENKFGFLLGGLIVFNNCLYYLVNNKQLICNPKNSN